MGDTVGVFTNDRNVVCVDALVFPFGFDEFHLRQMCTEVFHGHHVANEANLLHIVVCNVLYAFFKKGNQGGGEFFADFF